MYIGCLEDVVFETSSSMVLTPSATQVGQEARYEDHQVQGALPRSEFLAPELKTFDLDIQLNITLGPDPFEVVGILADHCREGHVLRLTIAGKNFGKVTLRSMSETWRHIRPSGNGVQVIALRLQLKEYV